VKAKTVKAGTYKCYILQLCTYIEYVSYMIIFRLVSVINIQVRSENNVIALIISLEHLFSYIYCNTNAFFSFDLFMVYIPECKQQLSRK
jgi:hypothetical protein